MTDMQIHEVLLRDEDGCSLAVHSYGDGRVATLVLTEYGLDNTVLADAADLRRIAKALKRVAAFQWESEQNASA